MLKKEIEKLLQYIYYDLERAEKFSKELNFIISNTAGKIKLIEDTLKYMSEKA